MNRRTKIEMLNRKTRTKTKTMLREAIKKFNITRKRRKSKRKKRAPPKKVASAKKFKI